MGTNQVYSLFRSALIFESDDGNPLITSQAKTIIFSSDNLANSVTVLLKFGITGFKIGYWSVRIEQNKIYPIIILYIFETLSMSDF